MFWTVTLPKCFLKSKDLLYNSPGSGLVSQRSSESPSVTINVKDIDKSTLVFSFFFNKQASVYVRIVDCKSCFYIPPSCEILPLNTELGCQNSRRFVLSIWKACLFCVYGKSTQISSVLFFLLNFMHLGSKCYQFPMTVLFF